MNLQIPRKQELEARIVELEDSLSVLKQQLNRQDEAEAPHEALDNLEFCIELVDFQCESFREFWSVMTEDLRVWCIGFLDNHSAIKDTSRAPSSINYRYRANLCTQDKTLLQKQSHSLSSNDRAA